MSNIFVVYKKQKTTFTFVVFVVYFTTVLLFEEFGIRYKYRKHLL